MPSLLPRAAPYLGAAFWLRAAPVTVHPHGGEKQEGETCFLGSMGHMEELLWFGEVPAPCPGPCWELAVLLPARMCPKRVQDGR